jgi:hypothetical protein
VSEPAQAAVTALAIRAGLALTYEAPGNRVARLEPGRVEAALHELGFDVARSQRYAMFYRHHPGPAMELFSDPRLLPVAQGAFRVLNLVSGRWGNKLAVSGLRHQPAERPAWQ